MIVELPGAIFRLHKAGASGCWMGRRRAFRNSRDFVARPKAHEYTHVCKLCWPNRAEASDDPSEGSLANSGDASTGGGSARYRPGPDARPDSFLEPG